MRILRIVYDWPKPWDGLAPGLYFLSRAQGMMGNKVTVLTGHLGKNLLKGDLIQKPEKNVLVLNLPRAISTHLGPFFTTSPISLFVYLCMRILNKVDVVHGHGHVMLLFNLYKLIFGWIDKKPYILHFHISGKDRELNAKERGEKFKIAQVLIENPLHKLSDRIGVKVADFCLCTSENVKKSLINHYRADSKKCIVIENGVPTHIFNPGETKQLTFSKEILCVGVINQRKGVDILIESMKYLPEEYSLRWIGKPIDERYLTEVKAISKNLGVDNRVTFEGYISNLDLVEYYRKAAIFVLAASYEGLPKVVLEALATGTKVLASGFKINTDIHGLYYIESLSPKNIAKNIKTIVESDVSVDVGLINRKYSWDAKAKDIDNIYKLVL